MDCVENTSPSSVTVVSCSSAENNSSTVASHGPTEKTLPLLPFTGCGLAMSAIYLLENRKASLLNDAIMCLLFVV
jgi:hypothetical protein